MGVYKVGNPYRVRRRDREDPETEIVHGKRYEHVYTFKTERELTLIEMRNVYYAVVRDPQIPTYTRIRYFECSSYAGSPAPGRVVLQYESLHPIPHAILAALIIAAIVAIIAVAVLIVVPSLAVAYKLTTAILELPNWLILILGIVGALLFLRYVLPKLIVAWKKKPKKA